MTSRVRRRLSRAAAASARDPLTATVAMADLVSVSASAMAWCSLSMVSSNCRSTPMEASIGQMWVSSPSWWWVSSVCRFR